VAQQFLHSAQIAARLQDMTGEGMPQHVRMQPGASRGRFPGAGVPATTGWLRAAGSQKQRLLAGAGMGFSHWPIETRHAATA
jgi:hypothetical protein